MGRCCINSYSSSSGNSSSGNNCSGNSGRCGLLSGKGRCELLQKSARRVYLLFDCASGLLRNLCLLLLLLLPPLRLLLVLLFVILSVSSKVVNALVLSARGREADVPPTDIFLAFFLTTLGKPWRLLRAFKNSGFEIHRKLIRESLERVYGDSFNL